MKQGKIKSRGAFNKIMIIILLGARFWKGNICREIIKNTMFLNFYR